jgi:hypothetical protein
VNAVSVWVGSLYGGLAECEGMLRDEGEDLVLEYQVKESFFGDLFRSKVREARIPRDTIASVTLRKTKTWLKLKTELVIQTTRLGPVGDVPGMSQGKLVLSVEETDLPAAEKLVADLRIPESSTEKPAPLDTDLA